MISDPDSSADSLGPLWKEPTPGEFWQHIKGRTYQIVSVANVAATGERVVVYTGPTGTWSRSLTEFLALFVPAEVAHQREIAALRRVIRGLVRGDRSWGGSKRGKFRRGLTHVTDTLPPELSVA